MRSNGKKHLTNDRIRTLAYREIRTSFSRFISLLIMSLLGVFCFAGLQATAPDMRSSLDSYLDSSNSYDLQIISSLGLTDDDVDAIAALDGVSAAQGAHMADILVRTDTNDVVLRAHSLSDGMNTVSLVSGRLPASGNEIAVEPSFLENTSYSIGDTLDFADNDHVLPEKLTITGTVTSPLYYENSALKHDHGKTTIGTGTVNYFLYGTDDMFDQDYFTQIYVTCNNAIETTTGSLPYTDIIDSVEDELRDIKTQREQARYQSLYDEASDIINKEEADADKRLSDAGSKLDDAQNKLSDNKDKLDEAQKKIDDAEKKLDSGTKAYNSALKESGLKPSEFSDKINEINAAATQLHITLNALDPSSAQYAECSAQLAAYQAMLQNIIELQTTEQSLASARKNIEKSRSEYNDKQKEYQKAENEYNDRKSEYDAQKADAEKKINDARKELDELKKPSWSIYDRTGSNTYMSFLNDADSIANLSKIFPVVFFAVAILISLISMNRMVEEDRGQIGILKSLGFRNRQIASKYLIFSFSAVCIGAVMGAVLGTVIIPSLIWNIYKILFAVPKLVMIPNLFTTLCGFVLSFTCICGTALITAEKVIKENPAQLLRPKAPAAGKRVILEHLPFIWNRLSFSSKIIVRNIFRYRKRVLVTVGGIMGCTALTLCGFGLKDAIVDIPVRQYEDVFSYDDMLYLDSGCSEKELKDVFSDPKIAGSVRICLKNTDSDGKTVSLFIPDTDADLTKMLHLSDVSDGKELTLFDDSVYITDKLAQLLDIAPGQNITVTDLDDNEYTITVDRIVRNYVGHYVFAGKDAFTKAGGSYENNAGLVLTKEMTDKEQEEFQKELLGSGAVLSVVTVSDLIKNVEDMLNSLNSVVIILIVLSAMLSFVVLYNLSTINIHERRREIATLKVLGFHNREVDRYITKENILLTLIGIALGLIAGTGLTNAVVRTVEIEHVRFIYHIKPISYVYSALISIMFTYIVNIITHFSLKKIDMIESLKSVE